MKRANDRPFLLFVSLILVFAGFVLVSGCLSSAIGRGDMTITGEEPNPAQHPFPPMYNYPKEAPAMSAAGNTGKFSPGDIIQPDKSSPVFDPDVAVIIVRNTGNGSYEVESVSKSASTWSRMPEPVTVIISYSDVERLFPDKVGHMDLPSLSAGQGT